MSFLREQQKADDAKLVIKQKKKTFINGNENLMSRELLMYLNVSQLIL